MTDTLKTPLRWVMHSPRRLLTVVALALALVMLVQCSKSTPTGTAPPPTASPTTTAPTAPAPPPLTGGPVSPVDHGPGPVPGAEQTVELAAAQVALAYLDAWGHPELPLDQWLVGIAPYVTDRYHASLKSVDPANTQPLQITGETIQKNYLDNDSATFEVPTNIGQISIFLVKRSGVWLVSSASYVTLER
ncbi:MAG: hypothetical protein FWH11_14895 [Micrococcales bacterium]|nr:hypothetical protein [Micrococcales bacterium]